MRQLLDVMHEAIQLPLRIHLGFPAQREAIQSLVVPQITEHRLYRAEALTVTTATVVAIDALLHRRRMWLWRRQVSYFSLKLDAVVFSV